MKNSLQTGFTVQASRRINFVCTRDEMFFYLSFLRPPPIQPTLHGSISITPQLSNDLRTELFEGTQDLYYAWALVNDDDLPAGNNLLGLNHRPISTTTKPTKLTTWRPSAAYKEIPVPVPPNVREGQKWRLVLTCQTHDHHDPEYIIDLRKSDVGSKPFPVTSMPVLFSSAKVSGAGKSKKQEMIERIYLLPFSTQGSHPEEEEDPESEILERRSGHLAYLKCTEKTSYDLDKVRSESSSVHYNSITHAFHPFRKSGTAESG